MRVGILASGLMDASTLIITHFIRREACWPALSQVLFQFLQELRAAVGR